MKITQTTPSNKNSMIRKIKQLEKQGYKITSWHGKTYAQAKIIFDFDKEVIYTITPD